jgi:hypothetical protein
MARQPTLSSSVSDRPSDWPSRWPEGALDTAVALQRQLSVGDRDWHALKSQRPRRAAEQLAAALVQLLSGDVPSQREAGDARLRALELLEHAQRWLRAEISDPGCPSHRR